MIYLGVGSSIGNAKKIFAEAEAFLKTKGVRVLKKSKIYKTDPVGKNAKNKFSNAVWAVKIELPWYSVWCSPPKKLLQICKLAEKRAGRNLKAKRWSDRELDLDILMFDKRIVSTRNLTIPHPEIQHRYFVLKPWSELVGEEFLVIGNRTIGDCLQRLKSQKKKNR